LHVATESAFLLVDAYVAIYFCCQIKAPILNTF